MHPVRLRCENSEYPDIPAFSRLAGLAPQRLKLLTYFFANPKPVKFRYPIKTGALAFLTTAVYQERT
jgi:hypothetical protein